MSEELSAPVASGISADELARQAADNERRIKKQHLNCVRSIDTILGSSHYVRHLVASLNARGCDVSRSFFSCAQCPEGMLIGGFWSSESGVVVCENVPRSTDQIGRTLLHELVHAYDWCRVDFSPTNCLHLACTEIRAANLSGDCNLAMEMIRGRSEAFRFTAHKQNCVKRVAIQSLMNNPNCKANAPRSVELAWDLCWPDATPFDHIP